MLPKQIIIELTEYQGMLDANSALRVQLDRANAGRSYAENSLAALERKLVAKGLTWQANRNRLFYKPVAAKKKHK